MSTGQAKCLPLFCLLMTESERSRAYLLRRYETQPLQTTIKLLFTQAKVRSKKKGWEFNLDLDALTASAPTVCPLLDIELHYGKPTGYHNPAAPSLDRFDSSKGYTKDNIWIISRRANLIKNDATVQELSLICSRLSEQISRFSCTPSGNS